GVQPAVVGVAAVLAAADGDHGGSFVVTTNKTGPPASCSRAPAGVGESSSAGGSGVRPVLAGLAGAFEQGVEPVEFFRGHVAEEFLVDCPHGLVQLGEQVEAGLGDAHVDDAPVGFAGAAFDQAHAGEPVDQAGDVGHADDHFRANAA